MRKNMHEQTLIFKAMKLIFQTAVLFIMIISEHTMNVYGLFKTQIMHHNHQKSF